MFRLNLFQQKCIQSKRNLQQNRTSILFVSHSLELISESIKSRAFVISDDKPFSEEELVLLSNFQKISVGQEWIQGHSVISILHYTMD